MIDLDSLDGINIINLQSDELASQETSTSNSSISYVATPNNASCPLLSGQQMSSTDSLICSGSNSNQIITCMLITANVGTIFDDPNLLDLWFRQLKCYLTEVKPQLVAIHCQEVGGKNYESSMKHVSDFTDKIIGDESIICEYGRVRIFLDKNVDSLEKFTALGSLYLVHDTVKNVRLYNFREAQYDTIDGRRIFASSSTEEPADHVQQIKFPQELFPECRWSRKGFLRTRWLFNDSQPLDFVNIHLFHDASNLIAMETTPSPYAQNRQKALEFTIDRVSQPVDGVSYQSHDSPNQVPLFIFGDFNFRLNTSKVIQRITDGITPIVRRSADTNEILEVVYHKRDDDESNQRQFNHPNYTNETKTDSFIIDDEAMKQRNANDEQNRNYIEANENRVVMTVGKKLFDCENLDELFKGTKNTKWLQELDNELDSFREQLYEFTISFSPSYPFKEDDSGAHSYMKTRCPAWCDRILFNEAGAKLIYGKNLDSSGKNSSEKMNVHNQSSIDSEKRLELLQRHGDIVYRLMGSSVPMGDHKPVLLYCLLDVSPRV